MKVAFLGDVALFGCNSLVNGLNIEKKYGEIRDVLKEYDYVVANLETPLTDFSKSIGGKSAYLKAHPDDVSVLKFLGVTHVSLANNHTFDYRVQGCKQTVEVLKRNSISVFGINDKYAVIEDGDNRLSLRGYCCFSTNACGFKSKDYYLNDFDPYKIEEALVGDSKNGYFPVLFCHWGQEHVGYPNMDHVRIARYIASKYRVIICGHHPHVLQGTEKIDDSFVAYSLGNFCFDDVFTNKSENPLVSMTSENLETIILGVELNDNHITDIHYIPYRVQDDVYIRDSAVLDKVEALSCGLTDYVDNYIKKREAIISERINTRKKKRNLQWYLKRLSLESVRMILNVYVNKKEYKKRVSRFIEEKKLQDRG